MCHPGVVDETLRRVSDYSARRAIELELLTRPAIASKTRSRRRSDLISFGELSSAAPGEGIDMNGYYLGVDLGGTKSHALIADERGNALSLGVGGPGNHETVGYEQMTRVLVDITTQALDAAGISRIQLSAAGFGIAGLDWDSELPAMHAAIAALDLTCPLELVNDAVIGLAAGAEAGWGVAVVAGTGCNCIGRDEQHKIGRMTGYGAAMAEAAGAGELVAKAVQAVSLEWSRRGKPTTISREMIELCGARDLDDLIEGLCTFRYFVDAPFAPRIFDSGRSWRRGGR